MPSIPYAMTWEILYAQRWRLLLSTLGALVLPMLLLTALRHETGAVTPEDQSMVALHWGMTLNFMLIFGMVLFAALANVSPMYAYPVRTSELVAWRLLPAMLIIFVQMVVGTAILDALFDVNWPIWGPAMTASVGLAAVVAGKWLTEKSIVWLCIAMTIIGATIGIWFNSRYRFNSGPSHFWREISATEVATLLVAAVISYAIGVYAVARNRRGESPLSLGLIDWFLRNFSPSPSVGQRLNTHYEAQCWFEWQRKGWVMPSGAVMLLVIGFFSWLFASHAAEDLYFGILLGGAAMSALAWIGGFILGNTGPNDSDYTMGHFLATRPISDAEAARAILWTAVKSLLLTWAIWAAAFAIVCAGLAAFGAGAVLKLPDGIGWAQIAMTAVVPWIILGSLICLGLLGRSKLALPAFVGIMIGALVIIAISKIALNRLPQQLLQQAVFVLGGFGLIVYGAWVYFAAAQRRLIERPIAVAAVVVWIAATLILCLLVPTNWLGYLLIGAGVSLFLAPIAAAPLALSANRHR